MSQDKKPDMVNHPPHYTASKSGVECIDVIENMCFNLGAAVKYIWRCDLKQDAIQDLEKASWFLNREIARRKKAASATGPLVKPVVKRVAKKR
jgi:hypothetical protein